LKRIQEREEMRARDLFFAMWTSDLFMKRVQENGKWTLMCPSNVLGCMMYMVRSLKKNTGYEEAGKGRNNQSAGVVGEDPRISN
jgi:ribonucleoside-diphosphate reductase alpha chain